MPSRRLAAGLLLSLLAFLVPASAGAHAFDTTKVRLVGVGSTATFTIKDLTGCRANITAVSLLPTHVEVTPAFVPLSAEHTFTVRLLQEMTGEVSIIVSWTGEHVGAEMGTCREVASQLIIACVAPAPKTNGGGMPSGVVPDDPVNGRTGELFFWESPDLELAGPLPLTFVRYYGAALDTDGLGRSAVGVNWRHSWDWSLENFGTQVEIVTPEGRRIEFRDDDPGFARGAWQLVQPQTVAWQLAQGLNEWILLDPLTRLMIAFPVVFGGGAVAPQRIFDGRGNELRLEQGPAGPTSVSDGLGREMTLTYAGGVLASITDGTRTVAFTHDGKLLTGVVDAVGKTWSHAYDDAHAIDGLLTRLTAPCGNHRVQATWDARGRVVSHLDGAGNEVLLDYGDDDTAATYPGGARIVHAYDASGRLASVTDPSGTSWRAEHDASGRRTLLTDRAGNEARVTWAPTGELLSARSVDGRDLLLEWTTRTLDNGLSFRDLARVTYPDGTFEAWTHDEEGNVVSHADRAGGLHEIARDARGNATEIRLPNGGTYTMTYAADGALEAVQDPEGDVTTIARDALGRVAAITYPGGGTRAFERDARDRIVRWTDEHGGMHHLAYDDNGNLSRQESAAGRVTVFEYDGFERLVAAIAPNGARAERRYDAFSRVTSIIDRAGQEWVLGLDDVGTPVSVTDPLGNRWSREVDADSRVMSQTDPLDNTTTFETDAMGFLLRATSPLGHAVTWEYDDEGRLTALVSPSGIRDDFTFDAEHQALSVRSGDGLAGTSWERDVMGQLLRRTDALGGAWTLEHDLAGRVTSLEDPLGKVTSVEFDAANRRVVTTFPDGMGTMTDELDAAGGLRARRFSDGTTLEFERDADGFLIGATGMTLGLNGQGAVTESNGLLIGRDLADRVTAVTYAPSRTVSYAYDARGLPVEVQDWIGGTTRLEHDAAGRLVRIERPNGVTTALAWDADGRLASIEESGAGSALASTRVERDGRARIVSAVRDVPLLPEVTASRRETTHDVASRDEAASHDALGRVIERDGRRYEWNLADQLVGLSGSGGDIRFAYDAFGRLVSRTENGVTRSFRWNLGLEMSALAVESVAGEDRAYHVYLPDGTLLYSIEPSTGARRFHHFDEMGNTVFSTADDGAVAAAWAYSPEGALLRSTGDDGMLFRWQGRLGQVSEGDDLVLMRARWLDTERGSFLSRDPDPVSLSPLESTPYAYGRGNPLGFVDPLGTNAEVVAAGIHTDIRVDVWCGDKIIGTLKLGFFPMAYKTKKPGGISGWFGEGISTIAWGAESLLKGDFTYGNAVQRPKNEATSENVFVRGSREDDDRLLRKMLVWMGYDPGDGADLGRFVKGIFPKAKQEKVKRFDINVNASESYGRYRVFTQVCNDFTDEALDVYYGFNWYLGSFWAGQTLIDQVRDHEKLLRDGVPATSSAYFDLVPAVFGGW